MKEKKHTEQSEDYKCDFCGKNKAQIFVLGQFGAIICNICVFKCAELIIKDLINYFEINFVEYGD